MAFTSKFTVPRQQIQTCLSLTGREPPTPAYALAET